MSIIKSQTGFAHPVALVAVIAVVAVVGLAGVRVMQAQSNNQANTALQSAATKPALPASLEGMMPVAKVKELAQAADNSIITKLKLETQNGVPVYVVTLQNGKVLAFNATTGASVKPAASSADDDADSDVLPAQFTVGIPIEKARQLAQEKFPSSSIIKIELDVESGKVVFSVRFADKARVDVSVADGTIVRTKSPVASKAANTTTPAQTQTTPAPVTTGSSRDNSGSGTSGGSGQSGSGSSGSNSGSSSGSTSSDDDDNEIRVEGTLVIENGVNSVTQNGTKYAFTTSQNVSAWAGKTVRVEGTLAAGNTIAATKVELR